MVNAASFTATVEAYNRASLSGDVPASAEVSFTNSSGSKGKVGQDQSATLTLGSLPRMTIHSLTLYLHSNKSSGAATISVTLGDSTWQAADGAFCDWPGMTGFSQSDLPLQALQTASEIGSTTTLRVSIVGSENSVNLTQLVVEYSEASPVPAVLTLVSLDAQGHKQSRQLVETTIGEGFVLPSMETDSVVTVNDEKWYWLGWSEQSVDAQPGVVDYWRTGDTYHCTDQGLLYGLYTNMPVRTLQQDTSFVTGEYALVSDWNTERYACSGPWQSGRIDMRPWQNSLSELEESFRYELIFAGDSLSIYHPSSRSWIGHAATSGSGNYCQWAWCRAGEGSIIIYSEKNMKGEKDYYRGIWVDFDYYLWTQYATYSEFYNVLSCPSWRLFPTSDIPLAEEQIFSTFPDRTPLPLVLPPAASYQKTLDRQGRLIIHNNHQSITIQGLTL